MTTHELYNTLISKPDLHSLPELHDNILIWYLYKDAHIEAYCINGDTCIDIISSSVLRGSLIHWHPDEEHMVDELYRLGKKRNILVLKKHLFGTSTFYIGSAEDYPLPDKNTLHFGKKKWDGGRLLYFEQR